MKKQSTMIAGLFAAALIVSLCACFSPLGGGEETGITLSFDGDGRQITKWPPTGMELGDIEYTIKIKETSTGISIPTINHKGEGTVFIKLDPGFYDVDIVAEHLLVQCAQYHSPAPIEVKANRNRPVRIEMSPAPGLSFTVDFITNGGLPAQPSVPLALNSLIPAPSGLTNGTDVLVGWYKEATFNTKWNFLTDKVTGDMTLYAKWATGYALTCNLNGGTTHYNQPVFATEELPLTLTGASGNPGYTFAGWYDNSGLTGSPVTTILAGTTSAVTLWAKWEGNNYTVSYDPGTGGSGTISSTSHVYGTSSTLANSTGFTGPTGATFAGWATSATGSVAYTTSITTWTPAPNDGDTVTLYARWQYTVSFISNGVPISGSPVYVLSGNTVSNPGSPSSPPGYTLGEGLYSGTLSSNTGNSTFSNWSTSLGGTAFNFSTLINSNTTLYANWTSPTNLVTGTGATLITNAVTHVNSNSGNFTLFINGGGPYSVAPVLFVENSGNLSIIGLNSVATIATSAGTGNLVYVRNGGSLTLGNNVTLQGIGGNTGQLVSVGLGSSMTMNSGSTITGNISAGTAGAVYVNGGTFTMNAGSTISNNTGPAGAVYVGSGGNGTFIMNGGDIIGNTATANGGAVELNSGTFTMYGGNITSNGTNSGGNGGGVYISGPGNGIFTKSGGTISGNTAGAGLMHGHQVYVLTSGDYRDGALNAGDSIGWNGGPNGTLWND